MIDYLLAEFGIVTGDVSTHHIVTGSGKETGRSQFPQAILYQVAGDLVSTIGKQRDYACQLHFFMGIVELADRIGLAFRCGQASNGFERLLATPDCEFGMVHLQ
jgi:hypothetical protein